MHFDDIPALISGLAGSAVGAFVAAVLVDDIFGVVLAIKTRTFKPAELASFLESQFGTRRALALAGAVATAAVAAYTGRQDIKSAVLAAATAGATALTVGVIADIRTKALAILASK